MPTKSNPDDYEQDNLVQQGNPARQSEIKQLLATLQELGGLPMMMNLAPLPRIETFPLLAEKRPVTVAFPPCAEELLALIRTSDVLPKDSDDIVRFFDEYFVFGEPHVIIEGDLTTVLDQDLLSCAQPAPIDVVYSTTGEKGNTQFIGDCCLCSPCVTLNGNRNHPKNPPIDTYPNGIRRLFIGDLVWLFYFERMGIFQILGVILDAYATNGRIPISNGSLDLSIRDDITALVLEVMVRQTKIGMSSSVRDRGSAYQTALGWTSTFGRQLGIDANINSGFDSLFHKFIYHALEFYRDKRLAVAIQAAANPGRASVATLVTISNTLGVLTKRFENFAYGRTYYNTLSGIVWTIAGLSVIRELVTTLGIPPAFNAAHEFVSAAYDLLVLKRPVTSGEANRYIIHKDCAVSARDILLDLEVIDHTDSNDGGQLESWLMQIESKVEAYRTAYRTMTGVDIGASETPAIEQRA